MRADVVETVAQASIDLGQHPPGGQDGGFLGGGVIVPERGPALGEDPVELGEGLPDVPLVEGHGAAVRQLAGRPNGFRLAGQPAPGPLCRARGRPRTEY